MEHFKRLTSQQLVMAGCGSLLIAGVLLSQENSFGYAALAVAALLGVGAFAKSTNR